jgi:hypothetical protein
MFSVIVRLVGTISGVFVSKKRRDNVWLDKRGLVVGGVAPL